MAWLAHALVCRLSAFLAAYTGALLAPSVCVACAPHSDSHLIPLLLCGHHWHMAARLARVTNPILIAFSSIMKRSASRVKNPGWFLVHFSAQPQSLTIPSSK